MVTRRLVLLGLAAIAAAPARAIAQQPGKTWRIGLLYFGSRESIRSTGRRDAFIEGMRELGYVEGRNFAVIERYANGNSSRVPALAQELVDEKVDVILSTGGQSNRALQQVSASIPVVVTISVDPVSEGLAKSLARPGRNFTGLSSMLDDLFTKHVELLRIVSPRISRIAVLINPDNAGHSALLKNVEEAARRDGIRVLQVHARRPEEFAPGFAAMARENSEALLILGDSFFVQHFQEIAERSSRQQLISTYSGQEYPEAGGFMSYGPSFRDHFRRAAGYVDKILRGTNPGDLPFEQPVKLEMVVNARTARALGIELPQSILLRVDRVIE